ncbi:MAG: hypothetical protein FD123_1689 [Bacteroidetes bacterium]|nr:MAG: hypothetical protein FD123_1689 [Bacteroidota bacterium]
MPIERVNKTEQYELGTGSLQLRAWVGYNQFGTISAWLNQQPLGTANSLDKTIGPVKQLSGKRLVVISTVQDIMASTNTTSITIELSDGTNSKTYTYTQAVSVNGGAVIYSIIINLI